MHDNLTDKHVKDALEVLRVVEWMNMNPSARADTFSDGQAPQLHMGIRAAAITAMALLTYLAQMWADSMNQQLPEAVDETGMTVPNEQTADDVLAMLRQTLELRQP